MVSYILYINEGFSLDTSISSRIKNITQSINVLKSLKYEHFYIWATNIVDIKFIKSYFGECKLLTDIGTLEGFCNIIILENVKLTKFLERNLDSLLPVNSYAYVPSIDFNDKVVSLDNSERGEPFKVIAGLLSLDSDRLRIFESFMSSCGNDLTEREKTLEFVTTEEIAGYEIPLKAGHKKIKGGSFASVSKKIIISKSASGSGQIKLKDEITWIMNLPDEVKSMFPGIISVVETEDNYKVNMEYFNYSSLRDLILANTVTVKEVKCLIEEILDSFFKFLYPKEKEIPPIDYIDSYHFRRVWYRIQKTVLIESRFYKIFKAYKILINGKEYFNIMGLVALLETVKKDFMPDYVTPFGHSDFHFENILVKVDLTDYKIIDPRGYKVCDYFYDFGKLSHSTNGLYDLIHEGRFSLGVNTSIDIPEFHFEFKKDRALEFYNELNIEMFKLFKKFSKNSNVEKISLFNEVMHFCSDIPFHLVEKDKAQKVGFGIYLQAVILINTFVDRFYPSLISKYEENHLKAIERMEKNESLWEMSGDNV